MTDQSGATATAAPQGRTQPPPRRGLPSAIVAIVGGAITAAAIVIASGSGAGSGAVTVADNTSDLATVSVADVGAATQTIDPTIAARLAEEAKSCRAPLAHLAIAKLPGTSGGTIRIRSGNYLSPLFTLTDVPQRLAIPFPAPYWIGHGSITLEGSASGAMISLHPVWTVAALNGPLVHNVVWKVSNPCQ